jgi:adenosylcobyric acid synthase
VASGLPVSGYEIHLGQTTGAGTQSPWLHVEGQDDGAVSAGGRIMGSYVHGLFQSDVFRRSFLGRLGAPADAGLSYGNIIEATLNQLADHIEAHLNVDRILEIARSR